MAAFFSACAIRDAGAVATLVATTSAIWNTLS
jgi:hypothetical protein